MKSFTQQYADYTAYTQFAYKHIYYKYKLAYYACRTVTDTVPVQTTARTPAPLGDPTSHNKYNVQTNNNTTSSYSVNRRANLNYS
jgi:hypothetical protein